MGIDAYGCFKAKKGFQEEFFGELSANVDAIDRSKIRSEHFPEDATHEYDFGCERLYSPHYRRGHWPAIAIPLSIMLTNPFIDKIWYGGDLEFREFDQADFDEYWGDYAEV